MVVLELVIELSKVVLVWLVVPVGPVLVVVVLDEEDVEDLVVL